MIQTTNTLKVIIPSVLIGVLLVIGLVLFVTSHSNQGGNNTNMSISGAFSSLKIPASCQADGSAVYVEGTISNKASYSQSYSCSTDLNTVTEEVMTANKESGYIATEPTPCTYYSRYDGECVTEFSSNDYRATYTYDLEKSDLPEVKDDLAGETNITNLVIELSAR